MKEYSITVTFKAIDDDTAASVRAGIDQSFHDNGFNEKDLIDVGVGPAWPTTTSLNEPGDEWYRNQAVETREVEGDIEFDADAAVSRGDDDGAYVQAWVWIPGLPPMEADSEGGDCD